MGKNFDEIKKMEDSYQLNTYAKLPLSIERGEGVYVFDSEGKRYLDLYGGHAVALTGHCHPAVVKEVKDQVERLIFYSNVVYSSVRADASKELIDVAPAGMDKVFFCNSGAESNETALKMARKYTGRKKVVAMKGGFHGRTLGALSATALGSYRSQFEPLLEHFEFIEFGNLAEAGRCVTEDVAAVILEPIQSMAGVEMAEDSYYGELRELCTQRGVVLIFDEVQTGLGRTGSWFFGDGIGVVPDIITLAKGIGGGIPVGAVLVARHISKTIKQGEHGSTFGGGPVAMAAIRANIRAIKEERLVENARVMGEYIAREMKQVPKAKRVKGKGLLLGIELDGEAKKARDFLLTRGILTGTSANSHVLRVLPPLILKKEDVDFFISILKEFN